MSEQVRVGEPGEVLAIEPMKARILPGITMGADAWSMRYRSTTATGEPTVVSGVVLVPQAPTRGNRPRPLVGYAVGTQGMAGVCAASRQLRWGVEYEAPFLSAALSRGWAVAVTDYPGLGTPGNHTYVVGQANGRAVLDAMRAARRILPEHLDPDGPLGIYGYSEGGNAAAWAAQLQPTYAPELRLAAAAVGAAPADLEELALVHDRGWFAFLLLYTALGFDAAYPELELHGYLNILGRTAAAVMRRTHILAAIALGFVAPKRRSRYVIEDPLRQADWIARLRENRAGDLAPACPVIIGHGRHDQIIPFRQSVQLAERWRQLGGDVTHLPISRSEHIIAAPRFARAGFAFLDEKLAAQPGSGRFTSTGLAG